MEKASSQSSHQVVMPRTISKLGTWSRSRRNWVSTALGNRRVVGAEARSYQLRAGRGFSRRISVHRVWVLRRTAALVALRLGSAGSIVVREVAVSASLSARSLPCTPTWLGTQTSWGVPARLETSRAVARVLRWVAG